MPTMLTLTDNLSGTITGTITAREDDESNFHTLLIQNKQHSPGHLNWLARVQFNGELWEHHQKLLMAKMVAALNADDAHPIADKLAAIAQGDTYDEATLRQARDLLVSIRQRVDHEIAEIDKLMSGDGGDVSDAAVLLAAVEPLYAKRERVICKCC